MRVCRVCGGDPMPPSSGKGRICGECNRAANRATMTRIRRGQPAAGGGRNEQASAKVRESGERYAALQRCGWTLAEIAEASGHTPVTVRKAIRDAGHKILPRRSGAVMCERRRARIRESARRYVERGEGICHIAFVLGVSNMTISRDLKAAGVKTRGSGEWRRRIRSDVKVAEARRNR